MARMDTIVSKFILHFLVQILLLPSVWGAMDVTCIGFVMMVLSAEKRVSKANSAEGGPRAGELWVLEANVFPDMKRCAKKELGKI